MSEFPESILPSRLKQESDDVAGNKFVISAQDYNKQEDEIRAIELALKRQGIEALTSVVARLKLIRDELVLTSSGTVAVKDSTVVGVDGKIVFPSTWPITTLVDDIPDATEDDEDDLDYIPELELADVSDMPDEGYISIINDVSTRLVMISKDGKLVLISPRAAFGKVGEDFSYQIDYVGGADTPRFTVATKSGSSLASLGLSLQGTQITGVPTAAGTGTYTVSATDGTSTVSMEISITIASAGTPTLSSSTIDIKLGSSFEQTISTGGVLATIETAAPLPLGVTIVGPTGTGRDSFIISGSPRTIGSTGISITVTDVFGASSTATITLAVTL
jgi:hypothetical protein